MYNGETPFHHEENMLEIVGSEFCFIVIQTVIVEDISLREIVSWTETDKVQIDTADGSGWLNPETGEITLVEE